MKACKGPGAIEAIKLGSTSGHLAPKPTLPPLTKTSAEAPGGREGGRKEEDWQSNMADPKTTKSGSACSLGAQEEIEPKTMMT